MRKFLDIRSRQGILGIHIHSITLVLLFCIDSFELHLPIPKVLPYKRTVSVLKHVFDCEYFVNNFQ